MNVRKRTIKLLYVTSENELIIRFRGKRDAIKAKILESQQLPNERKVVYLLDRLIHRDNEDFEFDKSSGVVGDCSPSGCYVTSLSVTYG